MTIVGDYRQNLESALVIAIAGTNTLSEESQPYDQLAVGGRADFFGGRIVFVFFNPDDQSSYTGLFQPPLGSTYDVVVAGKIVTDKLTVRGPIWADGRFFNWSVVTRPDGRQALRLVAGSVAPPLLIRTVDSSPQLVYPTNFVGYTLQKSPSLTLPSWKEFSVGTNVVALDPADASSFFRLFKR